MDRKTIMELQKDVDTLNESIFIDQEYKEHYKEELDAYLKTITRKEFLAALKRKYFIELIGTIKSGIPVKAAKEPQKLTDSINGAKTWLILAKLPAYYISLFYMADNTRAELEAYLNSAIDKKARELSRNRHKKQAETLEGFKAPMFLSELSKIIPSVTKKDYTETTAQGDLIAAGIRTANIEIQARELNGIINTLDINTGMIYFMLQSKLAKQLNNDNLSDEQKRTVTLSLKEYKELKGINSEAGARKNLKNARLAFMCFFAIREIFLDDSGENSKLISLIMTKETTYDKGELTIVFEPDFIREISKGNIGELPKELFKIDLQKRPNAFYIAKCLCSYGRNAGQQLISVKDLLKECRTIPKYEDRKETGNIYDRIISPFISSLESIALPHEGGFIRYEFTHAKGQELKPGEREALESGRITYDEFIKLYVKFEVLDTEKPKLIEI